MINMHKIILYILIGFGVASCSTPTTIEEAETQPAAETIVSKGFIGQTFSNNSTDSFGQTKQEFSFDKNGVGTYYVAWTVSSTLHEDLGDMSWEINEGKIHVHYTYKSSDGITSSEEDVFTYNKQRNELISTSNNSKVFKAVHSNSGSKQNDKAHEFSKKLSGISDDNQSFKDKTYFIQTDYSYIENNGNIKKQNNKIISWSFEVTNDLVKILMMVDKEHNFTGHYISNSQLEMRKSDGRKYCIFEISNNELLQVFTSGDTWHHQIQNRRQEGGDSYDEAEYNRQQEQAEYESSQAYYNNTQTNTEPDFNKPKTKSTILIPGQIITYMKNDIRYTVELSDENEISVARFEPANRNDSEGFRVGERRYKMQDDCIITEFSSIKYIIKKDVLIVKDWDNTQTFDFQKSNFQ